MKSTLRILYLEDEPRDVELVQETLASDGVPCQVTRVETEADFIASLEQGGLDLILPLIFVSGTLGEEVAIEALKIGATDYVLKTRLSRLVPSVQRALREAEERIDLSRAEEALQKAQAQLAHVSRVTALGELAASIAHEVNQPLTSIINNANACLSLLPGDTNKLDDVREALSDILNDADRASAVLARIRGLVNKSPLQKTRLHLRDVVSAVLGLARNEAATRRVTIQTEIPEELPFVSGDHVQLQQVLLNLIMNGMDAMNGVEEQKRFLRISGRCGESEGSPGAILAVQDFGIGLKPGEMQRLFDAFYTTKPQGLGMGLAISRSIIEEHGGRLWAEPNKGPGATFLISLPAAD
jgi:C4-dicarboxylate-specific signal transduction histidine kinase